MDGILERKIVDFIEYVSKNPGENASTVANRMLPGNMESSTEKDIVVHELLKLSPSKRSLVINIVRKKTNCNLSSGDEYKHNYIKMKEVGEVIREVPHLAKKLKWYFQ
jgi:hypothetical protein